MSKQYVVLYSALMLSVVLPCYQSVVLAGESVSAKDALRNIDPSEYEDADYLASIRKSYPIQSLEIQKGLSKIIREPMSVSEQNRAAILLLANGTRGLLWAINELHSSNAATQYNILMSTRFFRFQGSLQICISMLNDTREIPIVKSPKWEPPGKGYTRWRICDKALQILNQSLGHLGVYPRSNRINTTLKAKESHEERNQKISAFKKWWKKDGKGNKQVGKAYPSIVAVILSDKQTKEEATTPADQPVDSKKGTEKKKQSEKK